MKMTGEQIKEIAKIVFIHRSDPILQCIRDFEYDEFALHINKLIESEP